MKFVLKAKPQSTVVDADNSIDLYASDTVNPVVWLREAGKQEVATGSKPVVHTAEKNQSLGKSVLILPLWR